MKIEVTCCNDCIFCEKDWDPDSMGYDTVASCILLRSMGSKDYFIDSYDSYFEEEQGTPVKLLTILDDCPLKQEIITVELNADKTSKD